MRRLDAALRLVPGRSPARRLAQSRHPWRAYVDAAAITQPVLRALARDGLRPLGMGGRHKQLGDFFTDRKVPPALRKGWPIVVDAASGRIVWVCGLAVAHEARITGGTRNTCAALIGAATLAWTHQRPAHLFQKRNPSIRADGEALTHWLIYKGYTVR